MVKSVDPNDAPPISKSEFLIAGILTTVYGLGELDPTLQNVACLWLLHPRLETQASMEPIALSMLKHWTQEKSQKKAQGSPINLIVASFDQRNHGSREVSKLANESWQTGNPNHAVDMFSIYHGTSLDLSNLITYISSYIFPRSNYLISTHMVCGISLGGHSAWQCILHDPRITVAIIIIGCPDYIRLMSDRARLSKLESWTPGSLPESSFFGSKDFPTGLVEAVEKYDPAGLFLGTTLPRTDADYVADPSKAAMQTSGSLLKSSLRGKRILNMAGGSDKLVPYHCVSPFLQWLKHETTKDGWLDAPLLVEDIVFEGVGHEMTSSMLGELIRFTSESLHAPYSGSAAKNSRI